MTGPLELVENWLSNITERAAPVILKPHSAVHENIAYMVGGLSTGVLDNAQIHLAFWNPSGSSGKEAHSSFEMAVGGQAFGHLYEGGSLQATGTFLTPNPLNREHAGDKPPQWRAGFNAPIKTLGTKMGNRFLGGSTGANPNSARSEGRGESGFEWILNPSQLYIMLIHNVSGATVPAHIIIEYYEED